MITAATSAEQDLVSCEVCLKEVPRSEAAVPEATDYVVYFCGPACYFCGPACYQQWTAQRAQDAEAQEIEHE